jgi:hypothetical protein
MLRRTLAVLAATVIVTLAGGGSAHAKGPDQATVSGPGIDTTQLTMDDPLRRLERLLQATRFWDSVEMPAWEADPPPGDLGAAFTVVYNVPDVHDPGGAKPDSIRQEIYPFAASGPVVYLPPDQTVFDTSLAAGWIAADDRLVGLLTALGASRTATTDGGSQPTLSPAAHTPAEADDSGSAWGPTAAATVAGVLALGAVVALVRIRRRAARV